jgi:hypothetical protein
MPLTPKGEKIKSKMEGEYGKKRGDEVFYASENKGTLKGVKGKTVVARMDKIKEARGVPRDPRSKGPKAGAPDLAAGYHDCRLNAKEDLNGDIKCQVCGAEFGRTGERAVKWRGVDEKTPRHPLEGRD